MKQLTENFTLDELCVSSHTQFNNTPTDAVVENLKALAEHVLQPIRDKFGAVHVNSGYRCASLNKAIGGAPTSQHVIGQAADINLPDMKTVYLWIKDNLQFDQLIWEKGDKDSPAWIHVSYNKNRLRKQALRFVGGKYIQYK